MLKLSVAIVLLASSLPKGTAVSAKELAHLGNRGAVDMAFSRLTKEGKLRRVARGKYVVHVMGRSWTHSPSPDKLWSFPWPPKVEQS